jgi:hypothetical protein
MSRAVLYHSFASDASGCRCPTAEALHPFCMQLATVASGSRSGPQHAAVAGGPVQLGSVPLAWEGRAVTSARRAPRGALLALRVSGSPKPWRAAAATSLVAAAAAAAFWTYHKYTNHGCGWVMRAKRCVSQLGKQTV